MESRRFFINGVSQHRPDARLLGNQHRAPDGILQQTEANAAPLALLRHGQPCQDHYRNRTLTYPFADAIWRFQRVDLADGQTEIARHTTVILGNDEGLGRSTALSLPSVA